MQRAAWITGAFLGALFVSACGPQVRYAATNAPPQPVTAKAPEQVEVLDTEPDRAFVAIGVLSSRGDNADAIVAAFRKRAARVGCDAIVVAAPAAPKEGQRGGTKHTAACVVWTEGAPPVAKEPVKPPEPVAEAPPAETTPEPTTEKPEGAAGFMFGQPLDMSQKMCRDAKNRWKQIKGARYTCTGTGAGLPPVLRLRFCGGRLCELIVETDRTDAAVPWEEHFKQSREPLVQKYGEPKKATAEVPPECAGEALSKCVVEAKSKLANEWWWPSGERVVHQLAPTENGKAAIEQVVYTKWPLDPPAEGEAAPAAGPAAPPSDG